jgi:DNA-binding transcriptional LysR family regulator
MKGISLELYKVFWEIGKAKNITRAAENLYVSQPNISAALKTLEDQLHATLCVRTKKGITLTHEGDILFGELEKAFSHIQLAETKIEKLVHLESGKISISASDTICNNYLLPYITNFKKANPGIRLEITNRTSLETVELLKKGHADIGFINLPLEDASLKTTLCCEVHDVLIGGSMYKGLSQTEISSSELSLYPLVMLERKSNSRLCLDRYFEETHISLSPVLELGSLDLVVSFVKSNMGLAFIPLELCGHFIDNYEIFHIGLKNPLPVRGIGLVELSGTAYSCAVEQFKKTLFKSRSRAAYYQY